MRKIKISYFEKDQHIIVKIKSNYDIRENLNNYKTLITKHKKRIDQKHNLYYSNVTHFKNRLFDLNLR